MTEPIDQRLERIARRGFRRCEEQGCTNSAYGLGSRCGAHAKARRRCGHVTAGQVTHRELAPYVKAARAFVDRQDASGHSGVLNALAWMTERMREAQATGTLHSRTAAAVRWEHWLARFHRDGVEPVRILAAAIAVHLHRLDNPRRWPDDRFFAHQFGKHVLQVASRTSYVDGDRLRTRPLRKPSGLLLQVSWELHATFGRLLIRAAEQVHAEIHRPLGPQQIEGQHAAFAPQLSNLSE